MKKLSLAVAMLAVSAAGASGADMAVKAPVAAAVVAPTTWTGVYVGANAGYGWGHSNANTSLPACGNPNYFNCVNVGVVSASGTGSFSSSGFTGGVQAGYNFQAGSLVVGGEVDFEAFNLKGSRTASAFYLNVLNAPPFSATNSIGTDWLFTARGRLGLAVTPSLLLYVTGGLALTNLKAGHSFTDPLGAAGTVTNSSTRTGWTVGGGAEWMVARNWTVRAEYFYLDFGSVSTAWTVQGGAFNPSTSPVLSSVNLTANIARLGVNYKFN